jgi:putative ABC transport system permease protein
VIINEAMAVQFWPDDTPLGRRLTLSLVQDERPREIVGVVRNARLTPYQRDAEPTMYVLHNQQPAHGRGGFSWQRLQMTFLLRTDVTGPALGEMLRRGLADLDPDRPLTEIRSLESLVGDQLQQTRYTAMVMGIFAGIAILLAATGLYGVVAYAVTQRTREIGIRRALGAERGAIVWLVLRHTLTIVGVALCVGLAGSLALSRALSASLWEITPTDPPTYLLVGSIMTVVALAAAIVPVHRAMRVAPTVALRQE